MQHIHIIKFGGSSVANTERINNVAAIVARESALRRVVVVSAMQGITDMLVAAFEAAYAGNDHKVKELIQTIRAAHYAAADELGLDANLELAKILQQLADELELLLDNRIYDKSIYDRVVSYGERLSIRLVTAALSNAHVLAESVEASELIITNGRHGDAEPILDSSSKQTKQRLEPLLKKGIVPVVTGFIGATVGGAVTTLGRGGSDYTATILGYCLDAETVTIWTDVTGVMTADPRVIKSAKTIDELTYEEAAEMSYFGAKVLHPLTMLPASQKSIPIYIKNSFEPEATGTKIVSRRMQPIGAVRAVTTLNGLSMIRVYGTGTPSPLYIVRIIESLLAQNIDILVLMQSSSDHNTVLMVRSYVAEEAATHIRRVLVGTDTSQRTDLIEVSPDISLVAVVGDGIHAVPGLAAEVFSALAVSGISAEAIAYGSSKHNLTFAVKTSDAHNAVSSLHQAFQLVSTKEGDSA